MYSKCEKLVEGYTINFVCSQGKDHAFPHNLKKADGMTITVGDLRRAMDRHNHVLRLKAREIMTNHPRTISA